jgi:hypothetical protein
MEGLECEMILIDVRKENGDILAIYNQKTQNAKTSKQKKDHLKVTESRPSFGILYTQRVYLRLFAIDR